MSKALSDKEIEKGLEKLEGWKFENNKISKSFNFDNFKAAMAFLVRVGFEAESAGHHPEIFNVYNKVDVSLQTHDAENKVTQKDLDLALSIQGIL